VYAFIEEKERSKEEKTRGKSWEIAQISCLVSMLVLAVHLPNRQRGQPIKKTQDISCRLKKSSDDDGKT